MKHIGFLDNRMNKQDILFLTFSIICMVVMISLCFGKGVWGDEIFTFMTIDKSWHDMTLFTAGDVHPPLYYYIIKLATSIFGNSILIVKLATSVGFFGLIILAMTRVKRNWGAATALLFLLSLLCMPQMLRYAVQLRMYGWAMFFVTFTLLEFYNIVLYQEKKYSWVVMTLGGLAAAYTHYFALLAVAIIYFILLWWCILKKREALKYYVMVLAASVIGYLPWLRVFIQQITTVRADYWIEPLTFKSAMQMLLFTFLPKYQWTGTFIIIMYLISALYFIKGFNRASSINDIFGGIIYGGVFLLGIILSLIIRPIFVARYLLPSMPALYLMFSIIIKKANKYIYVISVIILLGVGVSSYTEIYAEEYPIGMKETQEYLQDNIVEGDVLISDIGVGVAALLYYYPDCQGYCYPDNQDKIELNSANTMWLFDTKGTTAHKLENCGFLLEECYSYGRLDSMEFTLYKMRKNKNGF